MMYTPLILMSFNFVLALERDISLSPVKFIFPRSIIGVVMSNEVFNMIGMSARRDKNIVNAILWIYFLTRLY